MKEKIIEEVSDLEETPSSTKNNTKR